MTRPKTFAVALAAASALVLVGCSSGDDPEGDATTPVSTQDEEGSDEPTDEASEPTDEETEAGGDDGASGGDAPAELVAWADDFCTAVAPYQESLTDPSGLIPSGDTPEEMLAGMQESFGALADAFRGMGAAVEEVGAPPIENGDEAYEQMLTVFNGGADALDDAASQLADLDPNDPAAAAALQESFAGIGTEIQEAATGLSETFNSADMAAAGQQAESCAALGLG